MTNAEFALLSLVAEKPRHGYEIDQLIEARGMREWTEIGFSSIYYLLKKLEGKKYIESKTEQGPGRGPARKVYSITQPGKEAYETGTIESLSTLHQSYPPLQLGLANLPGISVEEALSALKTHLSELSASILTANHRYESQQPMPYFVEAMFDYSLTMMKAEKTWLENFIQQLENINVQN